jgi:hypothetical protein
MPVVISEIITETVVAPAGSGTAPDGTGTAQPDLDLVVRRAVERVLEVLRQEWDR